MARAVPASIIARRRLAQRSASVSQPPVSVANRSPAARWPRASRHAPRVSRVAILVERYLSNTASFVVCKFCCVKDHKLLKYSPRLKNTCVRQVVLDTWFPPEPHAPAVERRPAREVRDAQPVEREAGQGRPPAQRSHDIYIYIYIYTYIYIYICIDVYVICIYIYIGYSIL